MSRGFGPPFVRDVKRDRRSYSRCQSFNVNIII